MSTEITPKIEVCSYCSGFDVNELKKKAKVKICCIGKCSKKKPELKIPDELQAKFDEDPAFKSAFYALTPGRQRGYIFHFTEAKQSATRAARIERYMPKIFDGLGIDD